MKITDMNWMQVEEYLKHDDRAVVPLGSTEQHAYLSLSVDSTLSERVAVEAAEPLGVPVFPVVAYGITPYFGAYPGTVNLRVETYLRIVQDILDSLAHSGFRRILLVNGHGGNVAALSALTTDLAQELKTPIGVTTLYSLPHEANAFAPILEDQKGVEHACEAETSMMLAAFPDNVRRNKIHEAVGGRGEQAPVRRALQIWKSFKSMTPTGVIGDARKSTAEKGEKLLDIAADLLAERLLKGEPWA